MPDRRPERDEIARILVQRSLQMLAPRRVGKTWLMHQVEADMQARGWMTIFIDVEGMASADEFLRELCHQIAENHNATAAIFAHLKQRLKQALTGAWDGDPVGVIGRVDAKTFSAALVESLAEHGNTLILVDEIALFVSRLLEINPSATQDFLYHLRMLQQGYPKVRWLLAGSIGLDVVARRAQLRGALVDLEIFALEPFSKPAAKQFLRSLSNRREVRWPFALDDATFDHFANELGWLSPYYVRLLADRIHPSIHLTNGQLPQANIADIDNAFDELLRPPYRGYFSTWEEHIEKNFPKPDQDVLFAILNGCCETRDGCSFDVLAGQIQKAGLAISSRDLKSLLSALVNDGFLESCSQGWSFRSGLLRRYWKTYIHE